MIDTVSAPYTGLHKWSQSSFNAKLLVCFLNYEPLTLQHYNRVLTAIKQLVVASDAFFLISTGVGKFHNDA